MKRFSMLAASTALALVTAAGGEQITITGAVNGPDGAPVPDCVVGALCPPPTGTLRWPLLESTTGPDGRFELRFELEGSPEGYGISVWAVKPGFAVGWGEFTRGADLAIELTDLLCKVRGRLADRNGNALAGLRVWVKQASVGAGESLSLVSFSDLQPVLEATTDEQGRFELAGLPPGSRARLAAGGEGWARAAAWAAAAPDGGQEVTIRLLPEAVISGSVTRDGQPVADVHLYAQGDPRRRTSVDIVEVETAPDGTYRIAGLPANSYEVRLLPEQGLVALNPDAIELRPGEHAADVNFELIEGAVVEGTVRFEDTGQPAVGVWIGVDEPAVSSTRTDERGHYRLRVAPGSNTVLCGVRGVPGYDQVVPPEALVEAREGAPTTRVDFLLKPSPVFSGVTTGPDGQPLPGADVWLLAEEGVFSDWWPPEPAQSGPDGRFEVTEGTFRDRPPWMLFARHADLGLAGLAVVEGGRQGIDLQLQPGGHLSSAAEDLEGNPLPGVGVRVEACPRGARDRPLPFRYLTDEIGQLSIGPLPPGVTLRLAPGRTGPDAELLAFAVNDAWPLYDRFTLEPGETRRFLALRLNPAGRSLSGVVVDQDQRLVAGAAIFVKWRGPTRSDAAEKEHTAVTDDQGAFTFTRLQSKGTIALMVLGPERRRAAALECDPDQQAHVILTLAEPAALVGIVYGADGQPAARVEVAASKAGGSFPLTVQEAEPFKFWTSAATDDRGAYRLEGLVPGLTYDCVYDLPPPRGWKQVERLVAEGGEEPMVLDIYME